MLALFEHPDEWAKLVADPAVARTAADEIVRWVSPVNLFKRTATQDMEMRGQQIKEGDKVVIFYAGANRDEEVFADPDVFDVTRDPNPQLGFGGGGAHFCLGNHLAKMELRGPVRGPVGARPEDPADRRGPPAALLLHQRHQGPAGLPVEPPLLGRALTRRRRRGCRWGSSVYIRARTSPAGLRLRRGGGGPTRPSWRSAPRRGPWAPSPAACGPSSDRRTAGRPRPGGAATGRR